MDSVTKNTVSTCFTQTPLSTRTAAMPTELITQTSLAHDNYRQ